MGHDSLCLRIEHAWWELKKLLYKFYPRLATVAGSDEHIREELGKALGVCWSLIKDECFNNLVRGIRKRYNAVIKAKGWHTKY